jgi:hypothetical protein
MTLELVKYASFSDLRGLEMSCRTGRDFVNDHQIWQMVAASLGWSQPRTAEDRGRIKRRIALLERCAGVAARLGYSAQEQLEAWRARGSNLPLFQLRWGRWSPLQRLAHMHIASSNVACEIAGSEIFEPTNALRRAAVERGATTGRVILSDAWLAERRCRIGLLGSRPPSPEGSDGEPPRKRARGDG